MLWWSSKQERVNKTLQGDRFCNVESTYINFLFIAQVKLMVENMILLAEKMTRLPTELVFEYVLVWVGLGRKKQREAFGDISEMFLKWVPSLIQF